MGKYRRGACKAGKVLARHLKDRARYDYTTQTGLLAPRGCNHCEGGKLLHSLTSNILEFARSFSNLTRQRLKSCLPKRNTQSFYRPTTKEEIYLSVHEPKLAFGCLSLLVSMLIKLLTVTWLLNRTFTEK